MRKPWWGKNVVSSSAEATGALTSAIGSGVTAVGSGATAVGSAVNSSVTAVGSSVTAVGNTVGSSVTAGATVVGSTVGSGVTAVGTGVTVVGSAVTTAGVSAGTGFLGGFKDTLYEIKDSVIKRQEAPAELIDAPTPEDRWFTPEGGWPTAPAEPPELPVNALPSGYKLGKWIPPRSLTPTAAEAPGLFERAAAASGPPIGHVKIEVLQCEGLPRMVYGIVDPYVVVVFESSAGRTSTLRNDRSPSWGAEAPRAFRFPVACPFSLVHVGVNDQDEGPLPDDALGRTAIDLSLLHNRTTYDAWFHLQYGLHTRLKGRRGSIRLRFSVDFTSERTRLLSYPRPQPSFAVPFRSESLMRDSVFAVRGKFINPSRYDYRAFQAHVIDLQRFVRRLSRASLDFLFWRWPRASVFALIVWQLVVTYPFEILSTAPVMLVFVLIESYVSLRPRSPLDFQPDGCEMWRILLLDHVRAGVSVDAGQASAGGVGDGDSDESERESEGESESDDEAVDEEGEAGEGGVLPPSAADGPHESAASRKERRKSLREESKQKRKQRRVSKLLSGLQGMRRKVRRGVDTVGSGIAAMEVGGNLRKLAELIRGGKPSLEEEVRRVRDEVEDEVFSQLPPEKDAQGFTLNPVARVLGPVQGVLHQILVYVRLVERVLAWDDALLTFQVCIALSTLSIALLLCGELLMLVPWAAVFEWTFRLVGLAALGPHMMWVGREFRKRAKVEEGEKREFAEASSKRRLEILEGYRQEFIKEATQRVRVLSAQAEEEWPRDGDVRFERGSRGGGDGGSAAHDAGSSAHGKICHLLLRPQPTAAKLRFRFTPDRARSFAYPTYPSEDRPTLEVGESAAPGAPGQGGPPPRHQLERRMAGTLHVYLSHATGLKSADRNGLSDPYVKLTVPSCKPRRSATIKKTLNPVWGEHFAFEGMLHELAAKPGLRLQCWDYDFASRDDLLGSAHLSLQERIDQLGGSDDQSRALRVIEAPLPLSEQGTVHIRLAWQPEGRDPPVFVPPRAPGGGSSPATPGGGSSPATPGSKKSSPALEA